MTVAALLSFSTLFSSCSSQSLNNHISRGEELLQKRKFQEAAMEFRSAINIDDESAGARWGLARSLEGLGQFYETIEELRRVIDLAPENLEAKIKLGNYLLAFNPPQFDETEKLLQEIFAVEPDNIEGHILKASKLSVQDKPASEVLAILNYAISLDPNRTESYISLSRFYLKSDNFSEAEQAIVKGISVNPQQAVGYLEYGRFLAASERPDEAEAQYKKGIEVEPANLEIRETIAGFYIRLKEFGKAEQAYRDLVAIEENSPESRMMLADFYGLINRTDEAVQVLTNILSDSPGYARARYRLGEIYLDRRETEKVREQVEQLFAVNDQDNEALILRVRLNLQLDQAEEAVSDLEEILKKKPTDKESLFYMAQARLELGQVEQGRAFIGDLKKFHPGFLKTDLLSIQASFSAGETELALRQSNELLQRIDGTIPNAENDAQARTALRLRALTARGLASLQLGKIVAARRDLQTVAELTSNSPSATVNLAKVVLAEGNISGALELFEQALAAEPKNFDALAGAVNVLMAQRKYSEAQTKLDQAIGQNAGQNNMLAALHYLKSDVYVAESNFGEAEAELKKTIELDDGYLPAFSAYAALLVQQNQTDAALVQYRKVVEKKPSASVYTLIGILEDSRKNTAEAEKNYRQALAIEPETPIAANNLAWLIATNNGNLDEALRLAQASVSKNPNSAGFYDTLGWVYYQKGLYSSAIEHLRKAVALDAADAARNGNSPNSEYRQRLGAALNSSRS